MDERLIFPGIGLPNVGFLEIGAGASVERFRLLGIGLLSDGLRLSGEGFRSIGYYGVFCENFRLRGAGSCAGLCLSRRILFGTSAGRVLAITGRFVDSRYTGLASNFFLFRKAKIGGVSTTGGVIIGV